MLIQQFVWNWLIVPVFLFLFVLACVFEKVRTLPATIKDKKKPSRLP